MYIYDGHLGDLYVSPVELDWENLFCETCGDSDIFIGYATTKEQAWDLFKDDLDIDGFGGWNYEYIKNFINTYWDK